MSFTQELNDLMYDYISDFLHKQNRPYVLKPSIPIIWFGNMEKYKTSPRKVVTIGINPSLAEFDEKRFELVDFQHVNAINELAETLNSYFEYNYYEWFDAFEKVLSPLDTSYFENKAENTAIHIDIYSAIATNPTWKGLSPIEKKDIQRIDLFQRLLDLLNPDIILFSVNEAVFNDVFHEFKLEKCIENISGKKRPFIRKYRNGSKILFWGLNMNGTPFGGLTGQEIQEAMESLLNDSKTPEKYFEQQSLTVKKTS